MKDVRIGNDISVIWSLYSDQKPFLLGGLKISVYLKGMYGKTKIEDYTIKGNEIHWTFFGKDQTHTGKYSLTLVANEGEIGMITIDTCDFVKLVNCSCLLTSSDDIPNVEIETIELTSELEYVANTTEGGSYDDTAIWEVVTRLQEDKADKTDIPTKLSDLDIDMELGDSYDDTELREAISNLDSSKVNKVYGKGLSSNDFTDAEKNKLTELKNYDDTEVKGALDYLEANKQDTIADLDTIRSGAEKGATALQEHQSLAGYATELFVNSAIAEAITNTINASY